MLAPLAYRAAEVAAAALPQWACERLARGLADAVFAARVPARGAADANLARLLPRLTPAERGQMVRSSFRTFAEGVVDIMHLPRIAPSVLRARVEVDGEEHLREALASSHGVVVLSAHLGSWEWGAAYLARRGARLHLAARPHAPVAAAVFERARRAHGVSVMAPAGGIAPVARALRQGEWLAVMADRHADPTRRVAVCAWAAALAHRTRARVVPAAMVRLSGGRHRLLVGRPLAAADCREGAHRDVLRAWLESHARQWAAFEPLDEVLA